MEMYNFKIYSAHKAQVVSNGGSHRGRLSREACASVGPVLEGRSAPMDPRPGRSG